MLILDPEPEEEPADIVPEPDRSEESKLMLFKSSARSSGMAGRRGREGEMEFGGCDSVERESKGGGGGFEGMARGLGPATSGWAMWRAWR